MKLIKQGDTVLEWYGDDIMQALESERKRALTESGIEVLGRATQLAPVDTGNLKNSLTYDLHHKENVFDVQSDAIEVGTAVHYAIHQEYGTKRMGARPFLRPALDSSVSRILQFFKDAIERSIRSGGRD